MKPSVSEQNVVRARFENDSQGRKASGKRPRIDFEWVSTIILPQIGKLKLVNPAPKG
jgi:hypothetical protein